MHRDQLAALFQKALAHGARRTSLISAEWNIGGRCLAPVPREFFARRDRPGRDKWLGWDPAKQPPLRLLLHVPCRRCDACMRVRRRLWVSRAETAHRLAVRSWYGTLTVRPEAYWQGVYAEAARLRARGVEVLDQSTESLIEVGFAPVAREITRYLKRIRKETGADLRYMLTTEKHLSGLPHMHVLLHEYSDQSVPKRTLERQWKCGFSHWRLVNDGAKPARYVTKYITKENGARVRASIFYGQPYKKRSHTVAVLMKQRRDRTELRPPKTPPLPVGTIVRDILDTGW